MRIGLGYDVHKLVPGLPLILGGVNIPFHCGLEGHSDADVLVHAIIDACLGAAALGDIGIHFPDSDARYKNISSLFLLQKVSALLRDEGFQIENIDSVIVAQRPKLSPYYAQMISNIAKAAKLSPSRVNVKATTAEGLGFTGQELGLEAKAIVLLTSSAGKNII
ncbi:MAG: 2-C-methyl-D-erythritol 2,4-cyclodiphosphate synthase [Firmicutes bacterium]|nr:2-C-methyl-D-erythritol 2,4-cyclodiphosphate synthase [Bacillota bacterium]